MDAHHTAESMADLFLEAAQTLETPPPPSYTSTGNDTESKEPPMKHTVASPTHPVEFVENSEQKEEEEIPPDDMTNQGRPTTCDSTDEDNVQQKTPPSRKPRRALSAYNLFFRFERERILSGTSSTTTTRRPTPELVAKLVFHRSPDRRRHRKQHGKISFVDLVRRVSQAWKDLDQDSRHVFEQQASIEKQRYKKEMEAFLRTNRQLTTAKQTQTHSMPVSPTINNVLEEDSSIELADPLCVEQTPANPSMSTDSEQEQLLSHGTNKNARHQVKQYIFYCSFCGNPGFIPFGLAHAAISGFQPCGFVGTESHVANQNEQTLSHGRPPLGSSSSMTQHAVAAVGYQHDEQGSIHTLSSTSSLLSPERGGATEATVGHGAAAYYPTQQGSVQMPVTSIPPAAVPVAAMNDATVMGHSAAMVWYPTQQGAVRMPVTRFVPQMCAPDDATTARSVHTTGGWNASQRVSAQTPVTPMSRADTEDRLKSATDTEDRLKSATEARPQDSAHNNISIVSSGVSDLRQFIAPQYMHRSPSPHDITGPLNDMLGQDRRSVPADTMQTPVTPLSPARTNVSTAGNHPTAIGFPDPSSALHLGMSGLESPETSSKGSPDKELSIGSHYGIESLTDNHGRHLTFPV